MVASYTDFQPEPEDNIAVSPKGIPSSFTGPEIAAFCRYIASAVHNLGRTSPVLPDVDGQTVLGAMAFQDPAAVNISGGRVFGTTGGFVPVGSLIPFHGSVAEAEAHLTLGFGVCDGRAITSFQDVNGVTRGPYTMPDLRYLYLRFYGSVGGGHTMSPGDTFRFNERAVSSTAGGAHDHGGATGGHALTEAELPYNYIDRTTSGASASATRLDHSTADEHWHSISTSPTHTHLTDVTNPFAALVPLKRLF